MSDQIADLRARLTAAEAEVAALREQLQDMIDSQQYRELRKQFFVANASDESEG